MKNSIVKILIPLMLFGGGALYAQSVSGVVSDANGPLPQANVVVKGTSNGTATSLDGAYSLSSVAEDAVLEISLLGYATQEVPVDGQSVINITLSEDLQALDEVVVVGYGTTTIKDATGAVDVINADEFAFANAPSPGQLLRGKVSGVQVTQASGEPGAALNIRVRGTSSLRSGNEPLIVVDGIPLGGGGISSATGGDNNDAGAVGDLGNNTARNPLNFINQNDIASINILKDASATAIYGSRGANGVIVITTKSGKGSEGEKLDYSASLGISTVGNTIDMMDAAEFASNSSNAALDLGSRDYNYEDVLFRTALTQSHDVSYTTSTKNSSTRISLGFLDQEGIIKETGLKKYTASLTNSADVLNGLVKFDTKLLVAQLEDDSEALSTDAGFLGNLMGAALYWNPTRPLKDENGEFTFVSDTYINPQELLESYEDQTSTTKILGSISPTVNLSDNLKYKFVYGIEYSTSRREIEQLPSLNIQGSRGETTGGDDAGGRANIFNLEQINQTFENLLTYDLNLNENFSANILLGFSYYKYEFASSTTLARLFPLAQIALIDNLEGGRNQEFRANSSSNVTELQSFFGRVEATILKDILVTLSVRRDGSSRVGSENTYNNLPAVGVGYKVFDASEGTINFLKVRGNWGITGNQEFDANSAVARAEYRDGSLNTANNANPDLKWETTTSIGFGADFGFFDNKISGSVDWFRRDTEDLIFPQPAAATAPASGNTKFVNLPGTLRNTGVEFAINAEAFSNEDMSINVGFNAAFLSNEMIDYPLFTRTGNIHGQGLTGAYAQVITDGKPIFSYYLREWDGFDAQGNSQYVGPDGNLTGLGNSAPSVLDKAALPTLNLGFDINVSYMDFDLGVSFYGAYGHWIYNNTSNGYFFKSAFNGGRNVPASVAKSAQNGSDPNSPSTQYLEKGDFTRLSNLSLGYTLDPAMLGVVGEYISSARIGVTGTNLFVITDYSGFDPEVSIDKSRDGVPSANMAYLPYPNARSYTFSLNVSF